MKQKRPRGRPKGTGKNDAPYLDQVADLMLADPGLKKTPAIAAIVTKNFPHVANPSSVERRLQRKWDKTAEERMSAAKERRAEARKIATSDDHPTRPDTRIMTALSNFSIGDLVAGAAFRLPKPVVNPKIGEAFKHMETLRGIASPTAIAEFDALTRNTIQVGKILEQNLKRNKELQAVLSLTSQPEMQRILEQQKRILTPLSGITRPHTD